MKRFTVFFLFISVFSFSQDFSVVDNVSRSAYKKVKSIEDLASRIDYDFKTDLEKVRAIFIWLTYNISYREKQSKLLKSPEFLVYYNEDHLQRILKEKDEKVMTKVFNERSGVCYGFSLLFNRVCDLLNIENELVFGYVKKEIGIIPKTKNHVWNAVKIKNKWLMIDPTHSAGYAFNGMWKREFNPMYFDVKPEVLNKTHFPSKIKWRRFLKQKELDDFCSDPVVKGAFFKQNIDILESKKGIIELKEKNYIDFKIKGIKDVKSILYSYADEGIIKIPEVSKRKNYNRYFFKRPKRSTTLQIYINNELALEYAVKVD